MEFSQVEIDKHQEALKKQADKINQYCLRKTQKETFECSARCCEAPFTSSNDFDHCVDLCYIKLYDQRSYAETLFARYNASFLNCIDNCKTDGKKMIKDSHPSQEYKAYKKYDKCTEACIAEHAFLLPKTVEKITEALNTVFSTNFTSSL